MHPAALVVPHPREDGPPPPPLGDRTTTVHAHLQAQKLQHGEAPNRRTVVQEGLAITVIGHKGGLLKRTDVHHRLSYIHKFITSVRACAVHSHRLHVSPSWLGCSTIYVHSRDQPQ